MGKKLFLNTFYTVVIIVCIIGGYTYGIEKGYFAYTVVAAFIIAIFILLKIKLLKEIRNAQKP